MSWILQKRKLKDFDKVAFERNLEVKLQQLHLHHFTEDYTGALWRIYSWPRRSCCEAWLLISLILQCLAYNAPLLDHTILGIYVTSSRDNLCSTKPAACSSTRELVGAVLRVSCICAVRSVSDG